jgi:hypothetical protein
MDNRLQYEQLISSKLESLPIPDMQDMIWSRIEAQLDIDMPSDGDGGVNNTPQTPPTVGGPLIWSLSLGIIAIATTFLIYKNHNQKKETDITIPVKEQPIKKSPDTPKDVLLKDVEDGNKKNSLENIESGRVEPPAESYINKDLVTPLKPDKDSVNTNKQYPINSLSKPLINTDSTNFKKKKKGVSGIKDSDYIIVPKGNDD